MSNNPLVSVIMPAYNASAYIQEAIESILNQQYQTLEFIIVDDGSTDATAQIIQSFTDKRIRFFSLPQNKGNRFAANYALDRVQGKYIVRMDADDISLPERIKEQVKFMESNPSIGFSGAHIKLFGSDNNVWKYPVSQEELSCAFLFGTAVSQPISIIRTEVLEKIKLRYNVEGMSYAEDVDFFYRLSKYTSYGNLDKVLLHYRRHAENITSKLQDKGFELNQPVFEKILHDYGINFESSQLINHFWLNARFLKGIQKNDLTSVYEWKEKLIKFNLVAKKFPEPFFTNMVNKKWDRLYYIIAGFGFGYVKAYMKAQSSYEIKKLLYYYKARIKSK